MGMSNAGVFISLKQPLKFDIIKITEELFGQVESHSKSWTTGFNTSRNKGNIIIGIHENGIRIMNGYYVNQIIVQQDKNVINQLNSIFENPEFMLAYMHYGSGDSFGYCYIERGIISRFRYSLSNDWITRDFGNPLEEELKILNGELYYEIHSEDDKQLLYRRKDDLENPKPYHFISSDLANEIMINKIGYGIYSNNIHSDDTYITTIL